MLKFESGGSWPPSATYEESWPEELKKYGIIAAQVSSRLTTENPSLDDAINLRIIQNYRTWLETELETINVSKVENILTASIGVNEVDKESKELVDPWGKICLAKARHLPRKHYVVFVKFDLQCISHGNDLFIHKIQMPLVKI